MICELCGDRGIIAKGDLAVPCSCTKKRVIENLFKNSLLPKNLVKCNLDNFHFKYYSKSLIDPDTGKTYLELSKQAHKAARGFIENFSKDSNTDGLLFTGKVGSGKTFLACCIANALLEKRQMVLFTVVPDLLDQIRSTYDAGRGPEDVTEFDLVEAAKKVPLLILDDLGAHNYTEWAINKIYSILNYRLNHSLPLIVTTNIYLDNLEEFLGERTTSRLFEMCSPYRLMVDIDIRALKRKKKDSGV